jgi:hypothetical protein
MSDAAPSPQRSGSGEQAVAAAAQRAAGTAGRNLPAYGDLPIPDDTGNLRLGPNLNDACLPLLPLVGCWRGEGEVTYPTMARPVRFGQQLTFAHDGRPFLHYEARSWLLEGSVGDADQKVIRPAARETGWWRPQPDGTLEVLLAHSSGIMEIYYGHVRHQTSWELATDAIVRTGSAKQVDSAHRLYGIVEGDLAYVEQRSMVGQPLQPHLSARLHRIIG